MSIYIHLLTRIRFLREIAPVSAQMPHDDDFFLSPGRCPISFRERASGILMDGQRMNFSLLWEKLQFSLTAAGRTQGAARWYVYPGRGVMVLK